MRKRLLSMILSLNLIFNYSLSGNLVIAEGDEENPNQEVIDELQEEENNLPETEMQDDENNIILDVVFNEEFPDSIYYGISHSEDPESGIRSVLVRDGDIEIGNWKREDSDYNRNISIPIKNFEEGEHHLTVEIIDNAGNSNEFSMYSDDDTTVKVLDFSTDFTPPKGKIGLNENSIAVEINEERWFEWHDDIIFDFEIEDDHPQRVDWTIKKPNSQSNVPVEAESNSLSFPKSDNDENEFVVSLKPSKYNDTPDENDNGFYNDALDENGDHSYEVTAIFYDEAGNSNIDNAPEEDSEIKPLTVHKDYDAPKIDKVSVSWKATAFQQVLRVLTFGIYSNDRIKVEVLASERVGDSGLGEDSVKICMENMADDVEDTTESTTQTTDMTDTTDTTMNPTETITPTDPTMDTTENADTTETTELLNPVSKPQYIVMKKNGDKKRIEGEIARNQYTYELEFPSSDSELYQKLMNQVVTGEISVRVTDLYGCIAEEDRMKQEHSSSEFSKIFANGTGISTDSKFYMIERTPPAVKINFPSGDGQRRNDGEVWYRQDHVIDISVQDFDSGICNVDVLVNDEQLMPTEQNDSIPNFLKEFVSSSAKERENKELIYHLSTDRIISYLSDSDKTPEDSHYVVKVIAEDNAGNRHEESIDFYVDKIAPEINSIDFSVLSADNDADATEFIDILEYGFYFKTELLATVNVSDEIPSSGLHRIEYRLVSYQNGVQVDEKAESALITDGMAEFVIPANFKGQIFVKALDYVENVSEEVTPQSFVVDTPERHDSEDHINITGLDGSDYSDEKGNALYDTDVSVDVTITDAMSGIRDFTYSLSSELDNQEPVTITISNTGNTVGKDLGDGWVITSMDENLVTGVARTYTFSSDNNDIQLSFQMTDRANNTSEKDSNVFSVDQTAPVVDIVFDSPDGNDKYYRGKRTATITVTERNFSASEMIANITNAIGEVPSVNFTDNSDTEHIATLEFGQGDYTFSMEGADLCKHPAVVNYSGGNENEFYVDLTDPVISVDNFKDFKGLFSVLVKKEDGEDNEKEAKVMNFTIVEHNFQKENVQFLVNNEEKSLTWENGNNDEHSAKFSFEDDGRYRVSIKIDDLSGNHFEQRTIEFEIDGTRPKIDDKKSPEFKIYRDSEEPADPIIFVDEHMDRIDYSITPYRVVKDETKAKDDNKWRVESSEKEESEIKGDTFTLGDSYFSGDGIYEVNCIAYDSVDNASKKFTHTYVVQRHNPVLVYVPENQTNEGYYQFSTKGIRSESIQDIRLVAYVKDGVKFKVKVDSDEVPDNYLTINPINGEKLGKNGDEKINQIDSMEVILSKGYFEENYNADGLEADLPFTIIVEEEGQPIQDITLGHIYIDNEKPAGNYEKKIEDLKNYQCLDEKLRKVKIESLSPDIDQQRTEIQIVNVYHEGIFRKERVEKVLKFSKVLDEDSLDEDSFIYNEKNHTITFLLRNEENEIRPTLVDNAGNINNLYTKNVYLGELFKRYWYLFVTGGAILLSIPVIFILRRKKRSDNRI